MANITFDGFAYLSDNSISAGTVYYQAYFFDNGTASSPSKWNNVRIVESTGYYNINLGDSDWLGVSGIALENSIVLIVFWKGNTLDRNSLCLGIEKLEEWGVLELSVTSASVYTNNIQVKPNFAPIVSWSLNSSGLVGDSYLANNTSYDTHNWDFGGVEMHHYRTRYNQDIQLINTITKSSYNWGDGEEDNDLIGVANGLHRWNTAGDYTVVLTVEDECQTTTSGIHTIQIKNNAPNPNISCVQTASNILDVPNTVVTFYYSGTDPDNKITGIDWIIADSGGYGNTDTLLYNRQRDEVVTHEEGLGTSWCGNSANSGAFTNPGDHLIQIKVYWFDGFSTQTINYDEIFKQEIFTGPVLDFIQSPEKAELNALVSFNNTSTNTYRVGTAPPECEKYDWYFIENGNTVESALNVDYSYEFNVNPTLEDSKIKLCAHWNDGWVNYEDCKENAIVFDTLITITLTECYYTLSIVGTSEDGSVSGYSWEIYKDTTDTGNGPWVLLWESPTALEQKIRYIAFTEIGYFKIIGFVHGNGTTEDEQVLYVDEVCAGTSKETIWDGTGPLDESSEWQLSGFGEEKEYAAYTGTYGIDATGINEESIIFTKTTSTDLNNHDSISAWVNIINCENSDIGLYIVTDSGEQSTHIKLSNYIKIDVTKTWQKVIINKEDFDLTSTKINKIVFYGLNNPNFYLDAVMFSATKLVYQAVRVCDVDMTSKEVGVIGLEPLEIKTDVHIEKLSMEPPIIVAQKFPTPKLS
jgi:hypothetical protein